MSFQSSRSWMYFFHSFILLYITVKLSLDDAVHISYSSKSTTFDGTLLRARFTNIVISPDSCDTNNLKFSPLISFRIYGFRSYCMLWTDLFMVVTISSTINFKCVVPHQYLAGNLLYAFPRASRRFNSNSSSLSFWYQPKNSAKFSKPHLIIYYTLKNVLYLYSIMVFSRYRFSGSRESVVFSSPLNINLYIKPNKVLNISYYTVSFWILPGTAQNYM